MKQPEPRLDEEALCRAFLRFRERGDTAAIAQVFDVLGPRLLLLAAHVCREPDAAEDLVQATFLDATIGPAAGVGAEDGRGRWSAREVTTDDHGRIELTGHSAGSYRLRVRPQRHGSDQAPWHDLGTVKLPAGAAASDLVIRLPTDWER